MEDNSAYVFTSHWLCIDNRQMTIYILDYKYSYNTNTTGVFLFATLWSYALSEGRLGSECLISLRDIQVIDLQNTLSVPN